MQQQRPSFWSGLTAMLVWLGVTTCAWGADVLVVLSSDAGPYEQAQAAIRQRLTEHQYQVKAVLLAEVQKNPEVLQRINESLAVLAVGSAATATLHQHANLQVPLFYCLVANPQEIGLHNGGPNEGVTTTVSIFAQVGLIQQALPKARHVGMLFRSSNALGGQLVNQMRSTLPAGWQLTAIDIDEYRSVAEAINTLMGRKIDIVWTQPDVTIYQAATVRTLLLASLRQKVPTFGFSSEMVRAGSLVGVGVEPTSQGHQVSALVVQRLREGSQAQMQQHPVHSPEFKIAINLIVADRLRIGISDQLKRSADYVFKQGDE